jgi:hypothetical protein
MRKILFYSKKSEQKPLLTTYLTTFLTTSEQKKLAVSQRLVKNVYETKILL